nr:LETM1 domain-containing protein 1-like isoform X2 [Procambarus clarkii]
MMNHKCLWLCDGAIWQNPYNTLIRVASFNTREVKKPMSKTQIRKQDLTTKLKDSATICTWLPKISIEGNNYTPMICSKYNIHCKSNLNFQKQPNDFPEENMVSKNSNGVTNKESEKVNSSRNVTSSDDAAIDPASIQSSESSRKTKKEISMDNTVSEKLPSRIQNYFLKRYSWYLKNFQQSLENEMPDTFNMFRIFTVGVRKFVFDFKDFIKLMVQLNLPGCTLRTLNHHELELYYYMPRDMIRVFPVLLISSIPFGQNIAFPIGYWFPRYLLCRHFWDIQQRHDFAVLALKKRLFNARPVFRSLQAALYTIADEKYQEKCKTAFYKLGSGIHPTVDEIVSLLPVFKEEPFHINRIFSTHVNGLLRLHGRSVWWRRRRRLEDHAHILHCMDAAISREGIDSLDHDQLKSCLFLRGLNPTNMSRVAMIEFLESWLRVSREVEASTYSLLLHLPIFLAYNQPSNIVLIY